MSVTNYFWIITHLLFLVFLNRNSSIHKNIFVFFALLTFFFINLGPLTFDLVAYDAFIKSPDFQNFEIGFSYLIYILKFLLFENSLLIIAVIKLIIILEIYYVYKLTISRNFDLKDLAIILMSLYVFLATQNILRQGMMLPLAFLSAYSIYNKKILMALFLGFLGIMIHKSMPLFFIATITPLLILKYSRNKYSFSIYAFSGFIFGLITNLVLLNTQSDDFKELYLNSDIIEIGRTPFLIKFIITVSFYSLTTYFLRPILGTKYSWLYCIRNFVYFFLFALFTSAELFSRFMVFCYFVDMLLILVYPFQLRKYKISSAIIFSVYAFTPQVSNILNGFYVN